MPSRWQSNPFRPISGPVNCKADWNRAFYPYADRTASRSRCDPAPSHVADQQASPNAAGRAGPRKDHFLLVFSHSIWYIHAYRASDWHSRRHCIKGAAICGGANSRRFGSQTG